MQRSFSSIRLFFFLWVLVFTMVFALQWIIRDDFRVIEYILYDVPHFGGIGWHWTFWVYDELGDSWDKAAFLFVGMAKTATFGIILGKLQYFLLRQQGYRNKWWVPMTLIAPFVASIANLTTGTLIIAFVEWLERLIALPIPWGGISKITTIAGSLGFGVTQWLLLRQRFRRATWWIVATALGEVLCGFEYPGLSTAMYGVLEGAIKGVITGLTMIWLLRRPAARVAFK